MIQIAFFWTPVFAAEILKKICNYSDIQVSLIVSQPDKIVGRKKELLHTPVKQVAIDQGIKILQPQRIFKDISLQENNIQDNLYTSLKNLNLDFIVVVAYGKIIPKYILDIPRYGCINLHGSILPKYRGASPVQSAIRDGVSETWLTTMIMSEGMDEWNIVEIAKIQVDKVDTTQDIFKKFSQVAPQMIRHTLMGVKSWKLRWIPQDNSKATYCTKILKEDWNIFFQKQSAVNIYNIFRAYTSWPGVYTFYKKKKLTIIDCIPEENNISSDNSDIWKFISIGKWKAKVYWIICAQWTILQIKQVKIEGKKSMNILDFINGNKEIWEYIFE